MATLEGFVHFLKTLRNFIPNENIWQKRVQKFLELRIFIEYLFSRIEAFEAVDKFANYSKNSKKF